MIEKLFIVQFVDQSLPDTDLFLASWKKWHLRANLVQIYWISLIKDFWFRIWERKLFGRRAKEMWPQNDLPFTHFRMFTDVPNTKVGIASRISILCTGNIYTFRSSTIATTLFVLRTSAPNSIPISAIVETSATSYTSKQVSVDFIIFVRKSLDEKIGFFCCC